MKTIIIPDIHGDFDEFCNILYNFNILDNLDSSYISNIIETYSYSRLNMNDKKIIQLGDILDSKYRTDESKNHEIKYTDMLVYIFLCNMKKYFPEQVILIIGNHEFLNYNNIFSCVSDYSTRNEDEIEYISKSIDKYFQYYYLDKNDNLFIHSSIPSDIASINMLSACDKQLKMKYSLFNLNKIYNRIFTRIKPTIEHLDCLGVKRVFMGHTPFTKITSFNNNRIFYCDICISKSFPILNSKYQILIINENNNLETINITRLVY